MQSKRGIHNNGCSTITRGKERFRLPIFYAVWRALSYISMKYNPVIRLIVRDQHLKGTSKELQSWLPYHRVYNIGATL